jgi:uncharacterized repeat protein (TIGR01451 family)
MSFPRPSPLIAGASALSVAIGAVLLAPLAQAAQTSATEMISGPLQNASKSTFVGVSGSSWRDTIATASDVSYPAPGASGVVTIDGTCVARTTGPTDPSLTAIAVADGSGCLVFTARITAEGFFTFVVDTPGAPADGRYLGDGSRGGVLDLIATTPDVLFAIPEEPAGSAALSGVVEDEDADGRIGAGDEVVWSASIENSGNVRLRDLSLALGDGSPVSCSRTDVDAGETLECTGRRVLTQAEVDAGSVATTLTATALTPRGTPVDLGSVEAEVAVGGAVDVTAAVTSDLGSAPTAGDVVTYALEVRNSGTKTITGIAVTPSAGRFDSCDATALAPGASTTCRVVRELSQADIDSGKASFSADVVGTAADGTDAKASVELDEEVAGSVSASVAVTSDAGTSVRVGQEITYTTTVVNTGTVTLSGVAAQPTIGSAAACGRTSLAPAASTSCTVTYTVTQGDVDAGKVDQSIAVIGTAPGAQPTRLGVAEVHDVAVAEPAVDASVVTDAADVPAVGDVVTATVTVTNTGNVTLSDVTVDPSTGDPVTCADASLAPGASTSCVVTRAPLTQADIDSGALEFTADVTATAPSGDRRVLGGVRTSDPVPATASASASMTSDAGASPVVGQTVTWTTTVTNTGNVTLSDLGVDVAGDAAACPTTTLEPGRSVSCTTSAELTQTDIDAGTVDREAIISAAAPGTAAKELTRATHSDAIPPAPSLSTNVESDVTEESGLGDQATWTVTVRNTGNVTLSTLEIGGGTCDTAVLAPGAEARCTIVRTLSQAEIDAGTVQINEAVTATTPAGVRTELARATGTAELAQHPALTATSVSDADEQPTVEDTVTVVVTVQNSGDVTIHDIAVRPSRGDAAACADTTLAPGAMTDCVITTPVTQQDIDAGGFDIDTAVIGSTPTDDGVELTTTSARVDVPARPAATLGLTAAIQDRLEPGVEATIQATVTNTGNVTLSDLALTTTEDREVSCPDESIAPGASATCTITVTVTQALVDAGGIDLDVDGTATLPAGGTIDVPAADLTIPIDAEPGATVTLTVTPGGDTTVGGTVRFEATVTNTGNVTLDELVLSRLSAYGAGRTQDAPAIECTDETIPVSGSVTCSFSRTITQSDVDNGSIRETTTAALSTPTGDALTIAPASVTTEIPRTIAGATALSADTDGPVAEGNRVTLTTTIRNIGTVTLRDLVARDGDTDQECVATDLAPGAETNCVSTRTVTADDVARGALEPTIVATAVDPQGNHVDLPDATIKIRAEAPAELAFTGVEGLALTSGAALLLLASGAIAMLLRTRRHTTDETQ